MASIGVLDLSMGPSLKRRFIACQPAVVAGRRAGLQTQAVLDDDQKQRDEAAQKLLAKSFAMALEASGVSPRAIADRCGVSEQAVSNWKRTGKIRSHFLPVISDMTGRSIRWLLTGEEDKSTAPPAPPPKFKDRRLVSESDWALLEEIKDAQSSPLLSARLKALREEIKAMRDFAEQHYKRIAPSPHK